MKPSFARVAEALRARRGGRARRRLAAAEPRAKQALDRPPAPGPATDEERGWHYFNLVLEHAGIARSPATDGRSSTTQGLARPAQPVGGRARRRAAEPRALPRRGPAAGRRLERQRHGAAALLERLGLAPAFDADPGLGGGGRREAGSAALPAGPRAARARRRARPCTSGTSTTWTWSGHERPGSGPSCWTRPTSTRTPTAPGCGPSRSWPGTSTRPAGARRHFC